MNPITKLIVKLISILASVLIMPAPVAMAHHSYAVYDGATYTKLTGTIKEFQWTNPHSWIYLLVTGADGQTVEWSVELGSPLVLKERGFKAKSMLAGDKVVVTMHPRKDGTKAGSLVDVTLPNQTVLKVDDRAAKYAEPKDGLPKQ